MAGFKCLGLHSLVSFVNYIKASDSTSSLRTKALCHFPWRNLLQLSCLSSSNALREARVSADARTLGATLASHALRPDLQRWVGASRCAACVLFPSQPPSSLTERLSDSYHMRSVRLAASRTLVIVAAGRANVRHARRPAARGVQGKEREKYAWDV